MIRIYQLYQMIQGIVSPEALTLLFLFFGLTIAVIIKKLRTFYPWIPYTPTLFLVSVGLGYTWKSTGIIGQSIKEMSQIDPRSILLIFLPPLIFQSSFNSDWYIFRKQSIQIFILAFPSVLIGAFIIMFSIKVVIGYSESYYSWPEAFMFGSVLSCTDTVAVLALLKEAGAPRKFSSLIQGQSLFNDGSCMVLFTISLQLVKGSNLELSSIIYLFLQLTIGAIIIGVIFGYLSSYLINKVRNDPILTLNITFASCYILYFIAEYVNIGIKISGIMALVSMGLYMAAFGKTKISTEAIQIVENFWRIYIFIAETIIFILGGVLVGVQALKPDFVQMMDAGNMQKLFYLYICMTFARFLSIAIFMPKLQAEGYGLKWKQVFALTYGGLRGAVGIAFTLILASNPVLNAKFRMVSLLNTSGCAFLTLMVNAPTCSLVIKKLGLCVKSETKIRFFRKFMKQCQLQLKNQLSEMKQKSSLQSSDWEKVIDQGGLIQLEKFIRQTELTINNPLIQTPLSERKQSNSLNYSLLDPSLQDIHSLQGLNQEINPLFMAEIRNRFCILLKGILWQKFSKSQCSSQSIRVLIECINIDVDTIDEPLNSWDYLISHLHNPYFFPVCFWLKKKPFIGKYIERLMYERVKILYDAISTYLDALQQCENACKSLPYDEYLQAKVIQESVQNRKLAQSFLDHQIKISYYEVMKTIQTIKASQSLLTYGKDLLLQSHQYGQIEDQFYRQMALIIEEKISQLQLDVNQKQNVNPIDLIKNCNFFKDLSQSTLQKLIQIKQQLFIQKNEPVLKSYQKQKFVYLVTQGQVHEQYKLDGSIIYQRNVPLYGLSGVGSILINRKPLQYTATAQSVVNLYCFPVQEFKQIISKNIKFQESLQVDHLLLEINIEPQAFHSFQFDENLLRRKKGLINFRRLSKGQNYELKQSYVVLIFGKLILDNNKYLQGSFKISGSVMIEGPAKFYFCNLSIVQEVQRKHSTTQSPSHYSHIKRFPSLKNLQSSIIRRTIYSKD